MGSSGWEHSLTFLGLEPALWNLCDSNVQPMSHPGPHWGPKIILPLERHWKNWKFQTDPKHRNAIWNQLKEIQKLFLIQKYWQTQHWIFFTKSKFHEAVTSDLQIMRKYAPLFLIFGKEVSWTKKTRMYFLSNCIESLRSANEEEEGAYEICLKAGGNVWDFI